MTKKSEQDIIAEAIELHVESAAQPHNMSRDEFHEAQARLGKTDFKQNTEEHREHIKNALEAGKVVPKKAVEEYEDLYAGNQANKIRRNVKLFQARLRSGYGSNPKK